MITLVRIILRAGRYWGLLRLAVAVLLLWVVASDTGPRLARLQFASLPDVNYAAEVEFLRTAGRYGEAIVVADAGLDAIQDPALSTAIAQQRSLALAEQQSLRRRAGDVGMGALSGRGSSIESLIGAVAADFFVVGDVRDLALEGGRYALDGEADEIIMALSAIGIITTLAPAIDWAPAVLKVARRAGTLTKGLADTIMHLVRAGRRNELSGILRDIRRISEKASPGGAVRLLRHADSAEDLTSLANFVERNKRGAFALHMTGKEGANIVKASARAGESTADMHKSVIAAAAKGQHGAAWLRTGGQRMMRPHLLVGLGKGFYKGNVQDLATRLTSFLDPHARWLLPLLAAWVFVELSLLTRRWLGRPRHRVNRLETNPGSGGLTLQSRTLVSSHRLEAP